MEATVLELPGYTVTEAEKLLGLAPKTGYRKVKEGKLRGYVDCTGQLRISAFEVYAYQRQQDK